MKMRILGKRASLKSRRSASGRIDLHHGLGPTRKNIRAIHAALDRGVTCFDTDLCGADVESNCHDRAETAALAKIGFVGDCHPAHLQPSIRS